MSLSFIRADMAPRGMHQSRWFTLGEEKERTARAQFHHDIEALAGRSLSEDEYLVRGMLLCNNERDYYYSRFSKGALREIASMVPGAPVLRGHDHSSLPEGKFFAGRVAERPSETGPKPTTTWVESLFYVPNDARGQELVRRTDLGVIDEVSIGWRCAEASCSVCGDSIYECGHIPGDIYSRGICEYEFSGVTSVLEGSFVFRGGQKDTTTFTPDAEGYAPRARGWASGSSDLVWSRIPDLKREACREERAAGMGTLFGEQGLRASTQSLWLARESFKTEDRAARYARDHDFRADKGRTDQDDFVFEQFPEPKDGDSEYAFSKMDEGARVRYAKPGSKKGGGRGLGRTASWLSGK